jgi:hypothetical protein
MPLPVQLRIAEREAVAAERRVDPRQRAASSGLAYRVDAVRGRTSTIPRVELSI